MAEYKQVPRAPAKLLPVLCTQTKRHIMKVTIQPQRKSIALATLQVTIPKWHI